MRMHLPFCSSKASALYDYIVAGSGIAGNVCSYLLQKKGYSGIILEKEISRKEKVCGGGIPRKALDILGQIGMNLSLLYEKDIAIIHGDCCFWGRKEKIEMYDENKYAIGCRRSIFDEFLLNQSQEIGTQIIWGAKVGLILKHNSLFEINGYKTSNLILSVGAGGLTGQYTRGQSLGISAQISGDSSLRNDLFYFFYYKEDTNKYFWIFPIGKKLWNIGLWYKYPNDNMKMDFRLCWHTYVNLFFHKYSIVQPPTGGFCGNVNLNNIHNVKGIGDYAGFNNIKNGGGIYRAIQSAVSCVEKNFHK